MSSNHNSSSSTTSHRRESSPERRARVLGPRREIIARMKAALDALPPGCGNPAMDAVIFPYLKEVRENDARLTPEERQDIFYQTPEQQAAAERCLDELAEEGLIV